MTISSSSSIYSKFISYRKQVTIFAGKSLKKNVQTKLSCVKTNVPMGSKALATS